ncbi:MAG TPA: hypothetical protein VLM89_14310, partial [Phycisphaerae bacterium]|nr:hypothetical protein [Phycisphaerae bacterium]
MAKQNVTFVERHLEKIVVGVTGAVLLATAVLYLVSNPHSVEVQGERVGPQELYATIREQAETTLRQMRQAQPPDDSGGADLVIPDINNQRSPYDSENIPREFTIIFAPLSPEVPMIKGAQRGKIRLAEILPPGPIAATSGRAYAKLATPSDISQSGAPTQEPSTAVTQDWNWVAVFSAVHRRKQRAKFEQAQYAFDRQHVIVAGVEAERQERLPDGQWGEARIVTGYSDKVIPPRKTADLIRQDDGTVLVGDLAAIGEYRKLLDARENQV